jgi:hypothetical protein
VRVTFNLFYKGAFKIIQTFVTEKRNRLMALLLYKWLTVSLLSFAAPAPVNLVATATPATAEMRHPFYVSVTEINHNRQAKSLEITCKIFADDLEDILKKNYKTTVDLNSKTQEEANNRLVSDYFSRHLSLSTDGKPVKLSYIGFEKDSESAYCYFEVSNIASLKKLDVSNSILQDLTPEQINIMHVTVNGSRKSYKLNAPHKEASFTF